MKRSPRSTGGHHLVTRASIERVRFLLSILPELIERPPAPRLRDPLARRRRRAVLEPALLVDRHVDAERRLDTGTDDVLLQRAQPRDIAGEHLFEGYRDGRFN